MKKKGKGENRRFVSFTSYAKWGMHSLKFKAKIVDNSNTFRVVGNYRYNRSISVSLTVLPSLAKKKAGSYKIS